jgi:hypothetical protein
VRKRKLLIFTLTLPLLGALGYLALFNTYDELKDKSYDFLDRNFYIDKYTLISKVVGREKFEEWEVAITYYGAKNSKKKIISGALCELSSPYARLIYDTQPTPRWSFFHSLEKYDADYFSLDKVKYLPWFGPIDRCPLNIKSGRTEVASGRCDEAQSTKSIRTFVQQDGLVEGAGGILDSDNLVGKIVDASEIIYWRSNLSSPGMSSYIRAGVKDKILLRGSLIHLREAMHFCEMGATHPEPFVY